MAEVLPGPPRPRTPRPKLAPRPALAAECVIDIPGRLRIAPAASEARFLFRGGEAAAACAAKAFGPALPRQACRSASVKGRHALWLGPDEWLLVAPEDDADGVNLALGRALAGEPCSLVAIGSRDAALQLEGPHAATILNAGCPLDLDEAAFPAGACTRTLFGKAQIVLWRIGAQAFRLMAARSFMNYVFALLREAALEHEVEAVEA